HSRRWPRLPIRCIRNFVDDSNGAWVSGMVQPKFDRILLSRSSQLVHERFGDKIALNASWRSHVDGTQGRCHIMANNPLVREHVIWCLKPIGYLGSWGWRSSHERPGQLILFVLGCPRPIFLIPCNDAAITIQSTAECVREWWFEWFPPKLV